MVPERRSAIPAVYTIGHSTRSLDELVEMLRFHDVRTLIDVRTVPRSRHNPQFNRDALEGDLPAAGIGYRHIPALGGLRKSVGESSPNMGWRNASFRGYADYMQTAGFAAALEEAISIAGDGPIALMCAEAVPWRCHRSLIADALLVRGVPSEDIQGPGKTIPHKLTPFARTDGRRITYPPEQLPLESLTPGRA